MIMTTPQEARELAEHYADTSLAKSTLRSLASQVEALTADAEQWRAYKARKDAVIAAGMGRNPLRQAVKPDTFAVINKDGEVEYSAPWPEACHDHIKEIQDTCGLGHVVGWKVRGITIHEAIAKGTA